jgi:sugar phosphate isomerase/epimerase
VIAATTPRYAVNVFSTPHTPVFDDIALIAGSGATGIGLWEAKLPDGRDDDVRDALAAAGLTVTYCVPMINTWLTNSISRGGVTDPVARTELMLAGVERLAAFDPVAILVAGGTSGDPDNPAGPLEPVADGLAQVADLAAGLGQTIGFELFSRRRGSPLHTLPDIVAFIDEVGRDNVGVMFDVSHSWCEPDLHDHLRQYITRISGVHVNDVKVDERSAIDRELPGRGRDVAAGIIATLIDAGYDGWWELELLSDDGTFGLELPDSYWKWPPDQLLREAKSAFDATYARALELAARPSAT